MPRALIKYHDREDGFTLVELLIMVLIIGILAAIAIPVYLGIQNQGYKSAVRGDVNISVKRVQVALTEGKSMSEIRANQINYTQRAFPTYETVQITNSATSGATANDYGVQGLLSTATTPAAPVNYTYTYDSVTGKFSESDAAVLGSSVPSVTITTNSLPVAIKDSTYSTTVTAIATNPAGTTVYSATGLPSTLTIDGGTGTISGTPTATGTYSVTVTATNGTKSDSKTYTLNAYSKPSISTTNLPNATANTAYSTTVSASGVPAPTFTATGLPTNVTIDNTSGTISGTPTVTGSYNVTVTATNAAATDSKTYTLLVGGAPSMSTTTLPWAYTNAGYRQTYTSYNQTLAATGYPSPTYSVTSGTLPTGLNLDVNSGKISGDATVNGTSAFTVKATNTFGSDSKAYTFKTGTYIRGCDDGAELNASGGCGSYGIYYNPNYTYTTEQKYDESWSWKITTTNQGAVQGIISCPGGQSYNLPTGTAVKVRAYITGTAGSHWSVGGRTSYDEANGQNGVDLTGVGTWQQVGADYTLTQASTSACIQVRQDYNYVGWVLYMDNVSFVYAKP